MGAVTTVKAISGADVIDDGGAVLNGGTISSGSLTVSQGFTIFAGVRQQDPFHVFADGTHLTATRSLSGGTFGLVDEGEYMIPTIATTLAGVANSAFATTGADYGSRRSINWRERARFGYVSDWDPFTGTGTEVAKNYLFHDIDANGEGAIDQAAHPTRAIPGLLAFFGPGPAVDAIPTLTVYPAKLDG